MWLTEISEWPVTMPWPAVIVSGALTIGQPVHLLATLWPVDLGTQY